VTASGALVKRPGDHVTLARAAFPRGVLEQVLTTVVGLGHEPVVYTDSFSAGFDFHCRSLAAAEVARPADVLGRYRAVGDDVNALPMIRGAGLGIAMGNAAPEVLAAADRIVASSDRGGLADVAALLLADDRSLPASPL